MPEIKAQHQCATLDNLILAESFGEPIGDLPIQKDSSFFEEDNIFSGTWECEPGILDLDLEVFSVFIISLLNASKLSL